MPHDALERFFERTDQRYMFRKDLRRCVIFGRNDLVQDAPISRIDLLVCRNTLMYFTAETQAQILRRFHFALDDDGYLLLGKSEMLITHADLFAPVELKRRVFRKVIRPDAARSRPRAGRRRRAEGSTPIEADNLREAAFDIGGPAQIVLDHNRSLIMANDAARRMFGLGLNDFGRRSRTSSCPTARSSCAAISTRSTASCDRRRSEGFSWRVGDADRIFDVRLTPLRQRRRGDGHEHRVHRRDRGPPAPGAAHRLQARARAAYEELQSTVEELETTNEELQSTNEELETTNEELQSTNEELETMNEELQSTNEELETMNEELRHRTEELNDVNAFLETILGTIGLAVAVLDRNQRVQIWNGKARELWGLTPDEAEDEHLLALDIGLPVEKLRRQLRATLTGESAARGGGPRGDQPARQGVSVPRHTACRSGTRRRRRLGRDHDDGGCRLLSASSSIRWRVADIRTRAVRMPLSAGLRVSWRPVACRSRSRRTVSSSSA